jgi:hypothetical protein
MSERPYGEKNPAYAHAPMAMWAEKSSFADVPLYAAPQSGKLQMD